MRRYAERTKVGANRSRGQIDALLSAWGAHSFQWTDDRVPVRRVTLRFLWEHKGAKLNARIRLQLDSKVLEEQAVDQRSGRLSEAKLTALISRWEAESHRLLLLFLKATFHAVDAGLLSAEEVFFPFFEDGKGKTVWEVAGPRLHELPKGSALRLLSAPQKEDAHEAP